MIIILKYDSGWRMDGRDGSEVWETNLKVKSSRSEMLVTWTKIVFLDLGYILEIGR